jgi:hypothetical protein
VVYIANVISQFHEAIAMRRIVALALLVCLASSSSAAQFHFGSLTLTVPDGFEIEQIAAPPLVDRPISLSFDEQGRLYATDSAGMAGDAPKMAETKPHRVMRLRTPMATGSSIRASSLGQARLPKAACGARALVCSTPQIKNHRQRQARNLARRQNRHALRQRSARTVRRPRRRIYWCKGAFAEQKYDLPKRSSSQRSHIFRARLDGGHEPVSPAAWTTRSVAVSPRRALVVQFFQNPAGGKRDGLIHAIYGGVYEDSQRHRQSQSHRRDHAALSQGSPPWAGVTTRLLAWIIAAIFSQLPISTKSSALLVPDGVTYVAKDTDFLTGDSPDFHPTEVARRRRRQPDRGRHRRWKICPDSHLPSPTCSADLSVLLHGRAES